MQIKSIFKEPDSDDNNVSTIYVEHNDFFFPHPNWTDFSVIIVGWWVKELSLQLSGKKVGEYLFMDGPFYFEAVFKDLDLVNLRFIEDELSGPKLRQSFEVRQAEFIKSVVQCAQSILEDCQKFKYQNRDVKTLESSLQRLNEKLI